MWTRCRIALTLLALTSPMLTASTAQRGKGVLLEELTWMQAKDVLTADAVVVVPLGAQAKEHGPHLRLSNDWTMAEYFKRRVLKDAAVVVAPTVNYSFYPPFLEYAGSTSLRLDTARDMIVDICTTLAAYGPKRFYVLNTGISTLRPLAAAADVLAKQGILMRFTDIGTIAAPTVKAVSRQKEGTHADEIETSMMLYIAPETVDMSKAAREYPIGTGRLTPHQGATGRYSPSGVYGDATLATREKGQAIVEATVVSILQEIDVLRRAALPAPMKP